MADTLAEIHNSTLQESDFNSSGETTLSTTNSSTKHVIKNVQITEGDSSLPVNGTLNIAGMDVVALTGNSTGAEIVGPSSAIKVKTSTFPLRYEDNAFVNRSNSSTFSTVSFPKVNDIEGFTPAIATSGNAIGHSIYTGNRSDTRLYMNIGPNNYNMIIQSNFSKSVSQIYIRQADGTEVVSYTDAYMPWWFDEKQFAYRYDDSNNRIDKLDCFTGTRTTLLDGYNANSSPSSYAHMSGLNDHNGNTKYLFFWNRHNSQYNYYDFSTGAARSFTASNDGDNVFQYNTSSGFMTPLMKTDGSIILICVRQNSRLTYYDWLPDTDYTAQYETATDRHAGGGQLWSAVDLHFQVVKNRFYYIDYSSRNLKYYDADIDANTTAYKDTGLSFASTSYTDSVNLTKTTPSNSTISSRTYTHTPSLKLRMTGVTST